MAVTSLDAHVTIPDGVLFKELAGETVLLNLHTGVYFGLDPVGSRIWRLLQDRRPLTQIVTVLLDDYDVDRDRCQADLLKLVASLHEHGLLELPPPPAA